MTSTKKLTDKWHFAIGTTSRVPDSGGTPLHYVIGDFDGGMPDLRSLQRFTNNIILQRTEHGWHLYTDCPMTMQGAVRVMEDLEVDPAWLHIGQERGYFFLADKSRINFPWPVEHMVLSYDEKKT